MAPNGNTRWPHTALLTRSTSGPERQYRWPPKAQILKLSLAAMELGTVRFPTRTYTHQ